MCATQGGAGITCWGANNDGEIGIGTFSRSFTPVDVALR